MIDVITVCKKIQRSYRNNLPEYGGLIRRHYPDFVYEKNSSDLNGNIPVFTYHSVDKETFERHLLFLWKNGYQTLDADELHGCLTGAMPLSRRAVVITFDDGERSLWETAFPLLKKYGYKAVCFIVPGLIREGQADDRYEYDPLCSWDEIKVMHEKGVIDFQSHTMFHSLIPISPEIDDFVHPSYYRCYKNFNIPIYKEGQSDNISRELKYGMPIYKLSPRFSGKNRYYDDESLRNKCIEYVKENGGISFFGKMSWRNQLLKCVRHYRKNHKEEGFYESDEDKKETLFKDLLCSKKKIEEKLLSKTVSHLCYPWWVGCELAVELSKEAGYRSNFWGLMADRRTTNRLGDDPYHIGRLIEDDFLLRLPGVGRESLSAILLGKLLSGGKSFKRKLY